MREVERRMLDAIRNQRSYRGRNTRVERGFVGMKVYLHGNHIATITPSLVVIDDCGYKTRTTYSRINAITNTFCNRAFSYAASAPSATGQYARVNSLTEQTNYAHANTVSTPVVAPRQNGRNFIDLFAL